MRYVTALWIVSVVVLAVGVVLALNATAPLGVGFGQPDPELTDLVRAHTLSRVSAGLVTAGVLGLLLGCVVGALGSGHQQVGDGRGGTAGEGGSEPGR